MTGRAPNSPGARISPSDYRVAISGSAGVGKTTLAKQLAEALGVAFSADNVRETLIGMRFRSHREMDSPLAIELCRRVRDQRIEFELAHQSFVADTSTVDNAAFWFRRISQEVDATTTDEFVRRCREHAPRYTHMILLPFGQVPLIDDGVRTANPKYQEEAHEQIRDLYRSWRLPYYEFPRQPEPTEGRLARALAFLGVRSRPIGASLRPTAD